MGAARKPIREPALEQSHTATAINGPTFAELLRRHRTLAGLSQEALAERSGLTPNGIGALERGTRTRPHPHTIHVLAEALELSPADRAAFAGAATDRRARPANPEPEPALAALPVPPSPVIGREAAIHDIAAILQRADVRQVTLTGIGGVGKTRLALEIARTVANAWPDGVHFIPLAALTDPALFIPTVARAIGLQEQPGDEVRNQLHRRLTGRRILLVLDNLEQLLPGAAEEIAQLLAMTGVVTLLVTSRAPLQIRAELEMPVEPLPLTDAGDSDADADGTAMALFTARARDVRPNFVLTPANAPTIAAICRQLGGLPLAIELAAAWTRVLTPDELLTRLDHVLTVEGARDLPPRQRTMRATLDWSHSLLSHDERTLFRRLAVFAGGFTLEAAEAVLPDERMAAGETLAGLSTLVDHSLVSVNTAADPVRYGLLEPVRQYAGEHLAASGDGAPLRDRHAAWMLELAARAEAGLVGPEQAWWLRLFDAEHPNLRSALRWLTDREELERIAELGWRIVQFWVSRGHFNEGARWLEPLLTRDAELSTLAQLRVRYAVAYLRPGQGRMEESVAFLPGICRLASETGDKHLEAFVNGLSAGLAVYAGDLEAARRYADVARSWYEANRWEWPTLGVYMADAASAVERGDLPAARKLLERAESNMRAGGDWWHLVHIINFACEVALVQGDAEGAAASCREAIDRSRHLGTTSALPDSLALLGGALVVGGHAELATRLFGAVEALRERLGDTMIVSSRRELYRQHLALIDEQLGAEPMADAWRHGRSAPIDDVIEESLTMFNLGPRPDAGPQ